MNEYSFMGMAPIIRGGGSKDINTAHTQGMIFSAPSDEEAWEYARLERGFLKLKALNASASAYLCIGLKYRQLGLCQATIFSGQIRSTNNTRERHCCWLPRLQLEQRKVYQKDLY